jgi:membrane protein DedA with SNARE-associated domain
MKNTQLFIVFALMTCMVWSGYYAVISWTSGPQWRIIASTVALAGFLTLSALYIHFLITDKPRK